MRKLQFRSYPAEFFDGRAYRWCDGGVEEHGQPPLHAGPRQQPPLNQSPSPTTARQSRYGSAPRTARAAALAAYRACQAHGEDIGVPHDEAYRRVCGQAARLDGDFPTALTAAQSLGWEGRQQRVLGDLSWGVKLATSRN
jgi:hypothetical protein